MRETALPSRSADDYASPTVLYAGRLIPEKGVRELIVGFRLWRKRSGRDCRLRIAGEGPLEAEVVTAAQADSHVAFLGKLSPARVAEELDGAQILVNPSNYPEGLPTILLEAGRAALPVISTPNGGSAELIDGAQTGWLIERGTPDAIACALDEIVAQPLEALRRGRNLYDVVAERHSWPSIVSQYASATS
jgi:glycosyltransferase involved in cell wall biosynthesis